MNSTILTLLAKKVWFYGMVCMVWHMAIGFTKYKMKNYEKTAKC